MLILRPQMVSPFWLGNVALATALLLARREFRPALMGAGLASFVLFDVQTGVPVRSIVWLILSNAVEVLTAVFFLGRSFDGVPRLNSVKALAKYSFYAVFLAPFAGAFLGALSATSNYWQSWQTAFLSEALGFLILMPAILGWTRDIPAWMRRPRAHFEATALLIVLIILANFTFARPGISGHPALLYSFVPLLLWSTLRFGATGVSTSMVAIAFVSIWGAVHGRGPFTEPGPIVNVLSLQLFLFFAAAPFMVLAALAEEQRHAEAALSNMGRKLIEAQEEERTWIARELHDDVNQRIALLVNEMEHGLGDSLGEVHGHVFHAIHALSDISNDIQALSHRLHSSKLEYLGIVAASNSFCKELSDRQKVEINFGCAAMPDSVPKEISLCLFRVLQETLQNAVKHSGVKQFTVDLRGTARGIQLTVSDSGIGFEPEDAMSRHGLGLISMRERLQLVRGEISIKSHPGRGTTIYARVPVGTGIGSLQ